MIPDGSVIETTHDSQQKMLLRQVDKKDMCPISYREDYNQLQAKAHNAFKKKIIWLAISCHVYKKDLK